MVMKDWQLTNSPFAYWYNKLAGSDALLWSDVAKEFDDDSLTGKTNLTYGLPQASKVMQTTKILVTKFVRFI